MLNQWQKHIHLYHLLNLGGAERLLNRDRGRECDYVNQREHLLGREDHVVDEVVVPRVRPFAQSIARDGPLRVPGWTARRLAEG